MKKLDILLGVGMAVWVIPVMLWAQDMQRAASVRIDHASLQSLAPVILVPGTVISRNDAKLAAEVTGRLLTVAEVGSFVAQGGVVASIEDTLLRLKKDEQQAEVARAQARWKYLESEEKRYVRLADSNLAAAAKLEETRSDRDVSRGDLQVAASRLAQIEDQLARTRLRAPFAGLVVERLMMPGERVDIGNNVVRMLDQQHLEVIARAPLEYFSYLHPGQQLVLTTSRVTASGTVRTVVAVGSENTHQFELRLDIEGNSFPVGQTLRVAVPISEPREALVVPRDALVLRPGSISVFVVDDEQKAREIPVTTGIDAGNQIEVSGQLEPGDRVIIRGNERLRPGQMVSIIEG